MNQRENWLSFLIPALAESRDAGLKRGQRYFSSRYTKWGEGVPSAPPSVLIPVLLSALPGSFRLVNTLNLNDSNCRFTAEYATNV